jgi:hypothetical protein
MMLPVPPRYMTGMDEFRKAALQIAMSRQRLGDEPALRLILGWGDARVPQFRKLG